MKSRIIVFYPCFRRAEYNSEYTYEEGDFYICLMCAHEWSKNIVPAEEEAGLVVKDANGNILQSVSCILLNKFEQNIISIVSLYLPQSL